VVICLLLAQPDLSPPVGSGPCRGIWYGPDLSETSSQ